MIQTSAPDIDVEKKQETNPVASEENWDMEISSNAHMLDLKLGEVWKYRDLLWLFVRRDFVAQYKQTILGPIWHLVQPIFTTLMFLLVFGKLAQLPSDGIEPVLFYMSGITIWSYFSTCLTSTSNTFISNASIFGKVYFPRLVIPLSVVMSNIVKFGIQFLLLCIVMIWFHFNGFPIVLSFRWMYIPLLVILLAGMGLGLGIIISSITTKYRDFSVLLTFGVQLFMYITPIVYPLSFLKSSSYQWIIQSNPLTAVVEAFRYALFGRGTVEPAGIAYSIIFMVVILIIGSIIFNKVEKTFMDTV